MAQADEILDFALQALLETTALAGSVKERETRLISGRVADAVVCIATKDRADEFLATVKAVDRYEIPAAVKRALEPEGRIPLLVAPYISPAIADRCRELNLSSIDASGNAFLKAPGLYVYGTGRKRTQLAAPKAFPSLSPTGMKVAFSLLCRPELVRKTYRDIAQAAGTSLGAVTGAMRDLAERGLIESKKRRILAPNRLLDDWVTHYPVRLRPKLHPRRFASGLQHPEHSEISNAGGIWGGEVAAARLTGVLRPAQYTIYTTPPRRRLAAALRLRAEPHGNVELLDRFWNFEATGAPDIAPPVLAYADLLASRDGRNAEAAKVIYEQYIAPALQSSSTA